MSRDFKIVEPDFVTQAKRSAVAAVEQRVAREEAQRRRIERAKKTKGCLSWLFLLCVAVGVGVYFICRQYGVDWMRLDEHVNKMICAYRYDKIESVFRSGPVLDWKDAPAEIRPTSVTSKTVYHALVPDGSGRMLLELTAEPGQGQNMRIRRISVLAEPVDVPIAEFNRSVARTPFLIYVGGNVYFCAAKRVKMSGENFRRALFDGRLGNPSGKNN